MKTEQR